MLCSHLASLFAEDAPLPPVMCFAMGTLGFLTPFDAAQFRSCLVRHYVASRIIEGLQGPQSGAGVILGVCDCSKEHVLLGWACDGCAQLEGD